MKMRLLMWSLIGFLSITACSTPGFRPEVKLADAEINPTTVTEHTLRWLPGPASPIPIAVYNIADETGAFQPSETGQSLTRAVTQAPTPILIKALQDAGNRRWFSVIERENLQNLLRERQIILDMRQRYLGETELNREALPALKFAGLLIEGSITGYDTNTVTGGAGARYLGIGGSTQYREDAVTVYLRAVSVKTGEVLISVSTEQRVASVAVQGNAFRFVSFQELLEAEAGVTMNQPRHLAVRQAFEKAVYGMIVEGAELGLWGFADKVAGHAAIEHYHSSYEPRLEEKRSKSVPKAFYEARDRERHRAIAAHQSRQRQLAAQQNSARQQQLAALAKTEQQERTRQRAAISAAQAQARAEQARRASTAKPEQTAQGKPTAKSVQPKAENIARRNEISGPIIVSSHGGTPRPLQIVRASASSSQRAEGSQSPVSVETVAEAAGPASSKGELVSSNARIGPFKPTQTQIDALQMLASLKEADEILNMTDVDTVLNTVAAASGTLNSTAEYAATSNLEADKRGAT